MRLSPRVFNRFFNSKLVTNVKKGTNYMFQNHFLATNVGISAVISAAGDSIQQHYEKYKDEDRKFNWTRLRNMSISGVTIGVVCHYWYIFLDKRIPGKTFRIAVKKMLLDQVICSPITIGTFFGTLAILEENSAKEFLDELRCKSWRLYVAEWIIWPPAQIINFLWLPLKYRVLFDNSVSVCYDVYSSYLKHEVSAECESANTGTIPNAACSTQTKHVSSSLTSCTQSSSMAI